MARLLAARGITAFVLFYRLPHEGWAAGPDVPLADARRAMRLVRRRRAGVDPRRVCAMGFSAGGHVCASLLTRFGDCPSAAAATRRPCIYPVVSMSAPDAHAGSRRNLIGEAPTPALRARPFAPPPRARRRAADLPPPRRGRCLGAGREHAADARRAARAGRARPKPISSPTAATASACGWRGANPSSIGPICSSPGAATGGLWP